MTKHKSVAIIIVLLILIILVLFMNSFSIIKKTQTSDSDSGPSPPAVLPPEDQPIPKDAILCSQESRNAQACIEIYQPVCGFVKVECITTPCNLDPQTFSNSCFACMNDRVQYYTQGECS
ncbi:MAG: hypothetical protein ACE5ES_01960 [Candidatus Nanoarchaeia archaeon]